MSRIYVCHTFYHVYVSILKEMKLEREDTAYEKGDIALSSISTDFGDLEGQVIPQESGPLSIAPVISPKKGYQYTKREV